LNIRQFSGYDIIFMYSLNRKLFRVCNYV